MWFGGDAIMAVVMIALVVGWLRRADIGAHRGAELAGAGAARDVGRATSPRGPTNRALSTTSDAARDVLQRMAGRR